jgi:HAD superfamily hydrolase (TIGR01509 family)
VQRNRKPKCVVFDCDGTLVDSEMLGHDVLSEQLASAGVSAAPDALCSRFQGIQLARILEELQAESAVSLPRDFVPRFRETLGAAFERRLKPIPGVRSALEQVSMPMCVVSGGPQEKIRLSLHLTNLKHFFGDRIFSSYDINSWKPEPTLLLHAAERMGFDAGDCIVVDDVEIGIQAALSAGMRVLWYTSKEPFDGLGRTEAIRFSLMEQLHELLGAV